MSKRSAEGPQGDKDTNLFEFNMSSTPDEKPQRATAAQLANRKIKDFRRRRPNTSTTPSTTTASFGGPFSSIDPNTVSSTATTSSQPISNGFTFGQSQSFPGAGSSPKPPIQNGGTPFAFGSGGGSGGSSSFNFSSSFSGAGTGASNPFANMNAGSTGQQPDGGSFSGFKGNLFNVPPGGSQAPAQQPLPSGGLFGASSQPNSTPTGGLFGINATSGPSAQPATTTPTTGGIFGQSTTPAPSASVFGQSVTEKPSPFSQSTAFSDDSMQTSPDAKANAPKASLFGSGNNSQPSFGGGNLFGGSTSAPADRIPSKPLFGAKPSDKPASASTSLFGGPIQPSSPASGPSPSISTPTSTATTSAPTSLFTTAPAPKPPTSISNPFQATNLFAGVAAPATSQKPGNEQKTENTKANEPAQTKSGSQFPSTAPLFSKSASAAPVPSSSPFQAPSTGSLFAPKPAAPMEQEKPKPAEANPFGSLFIPKPTTGDTPKTEQKPLPPSSPFNGFSTPKLDATSEALKTSEASKASGPATTLFASSPALTSTSTTQPPVFSLSSTKKISSESLFASNTVLQSPSTTNGESVSSSTPSKSTLNAPVQSFETLRPAKLPPNLDKETKEEVELLYRIRMLNECFKREISTLDPSVHSFDPVVLFYMRVRETIGAPLFEKTKRKTTDAESSTADSAPSKKTKAFGKSEVLPASSSGTPVLPTTNNAAGTQPQLSGASQATSTKESPENGHDDVISTTQPQKHVNGDSTTASIFANSFSRSKTSENDNDASRGESPQKLNGPSFKPSTPQPSKPAFFSTTPTSSPPKPLFAPSTAPKDSSSTPLSKPFSSSQPTFSAPTNDAIPESPFVNKPSEDKTAGASTSSASTIPKFGLAASGGTDFFAQFKAVSQKAAEKEKAKRKAEEFDSEEEDEAEWERKDAENQRKKQQEFEAQRTKRAKFVPGQGFSFEEDDSPDKTKIDAPTTIGPSVFNAKQTSSAQPNNIFGHLSATPSETEENNDQDDAEDTEEASVDGDDTNDPLFVPASEDENSEDAEAESDAKKVSIAESSTQESSDDGDLSTSLKKSKQATSDEASKDGRSLFDRVQYDEAGKPKRQGEEGKDSTLSTFFNSSKYASSFNSPASTPNPFAAAGQSQSDKGKVEEGSTKSAPTNIFGASNPTGSIFGSPTPTPTATTPLFGVGSSASKQATDNTWKINSPIKFATDSAATSTPKPDSGSGTPAPDSSNPFSTLFGAPAAGSKSASSTQPTLGFSFGGPSQQSSFLTPPALTSTTPSRASTPGVTSDTGAEESADGDATETLPQVNLARSGVGEENEDVVIELKVRALKFVSGSWESQGVGYVRILKDRTTSRGRALIRADPSGKVVLNTLLKKEIKYTVNGKCVYFPVFTSNGSPEQWAIRAMADADKLASAMEETKS